MRTTTFQSFDEKCFFFCLAFALQKTNVGGLAILGLALKFKMVILDCLDLLLYRLFVFTFELKSVREQTKDFFLQ